MSDLPTQERVVSEAPSRSYQTSHNPSGYPQSPSLPGVSLGPDTIHRQESRGGSLQRHPSPTAVYISRPEEDAAFRAPGVHTILNPLSRSSQQSSENQSLQSRRQYPGGPQPMIIGSTSISHQPANFDAANSQISPPGALFVSNPQQTTIPAFPTLTGNQRYRQLESREPRHTDPKSSGQRSRANQGVVSPTKRRKLTQTPPAVDRQDAAANIGTDSGGHFPRYGPKGASISSMRSGDIDHTVEDSPSHQLEKPPMTYGGLKQEPAQSPDQPANHRFMATLQTDQGPIYFPVDTHAASRLADERRRRNAGASARFRARRKEREQASSREIDDLKEVIRDLREDVDFYRRERDYLAGELLQNQDRTRHFPRPPSPRHYRLKSQSEDSTTLSQNIDPRGISPSYQGFGSRETTETSPREAYQAIAAQNIPTVGMHAANHPSYAERPEPLSTVRTIAPQGQQLHGSPDKQQTREEYPSRFGQARSPHNPPYQR